MILLDSQVEKLPHDLHGILRPLYSMTRRSRITVDLKIVAAFEALVSEEMDGLVLDARQPFGRVCFSFHMLETVRLVPSVRENVE